MTMTSQRFAEIASKAAALKAADVHISESTTANDSLTDFASVDALIETALRENPDERAPL
jgi:hypothetical protein